MKKYLVIFYFKYIETTADGAKVYRNQKQEEMYHFNCHKNKYDNEDDKKIDQESAYDNVKQSAQPIRRNVSEFLKIRVVDAKNLAQKQDTSKLVYFN